MSRSSFQGTVTVFFFSRSDGIVIYAILLAHTRPGSWSRLREGSPCSQNPGSFLLYGPAGRWNGLDNAASQFDRNPLNDYLLPKTNSTLRTAPTPRFPIQARTKQICQARSSIHKKPFDNTDRLAAIPTRLVVAIGSNHLGAWLADR
jgi:hypothetical protein